MYKLARVFWITFFIFWIAILFVPIAKVTTWDRAGVTTSYDVYVWMSYGFALDHVVNPPRRFPGNTWANAIALVLVHDVFAAVPAVFVALVHRSLKRG